jgi:hypothetical protein
MSERALRRAGILRKLTLLGGIAASLAYAPFGSAESDSRVTNGDGWSIRNAAYLWMASINGTQTVKGAESELDMPFSETLDVLDFAAEAHIEAMKDNRWGLFFDGTYLKLGPKARQGPVKIRIDYKYWMLEFGGVYRASTWETANGRAAVDLLLGGRYTSMDTEIDFRNVPLPSVGEKQSWTDLIAGARLLMDLPSNWSMTLRGDVGGFGIGNSSDLALQGVLLFKWNYRPAWDLVVGYRALYQDYKTGKRGLEFAYDATSHGPLLGVEYSF